MTEMGIKRELNQDFDAVLAALPPALSKEGFGVLTQIDIQATLKAKIGVDFRRYQILAACNPPFAHQALNTDLAVGLLLPCNVVVYETEPGKTTVIAVDPVQTMGVADMPALSELAVEVKTRLARAVAAL